MSDPDHVFVEGPLVAPVSGFRDQLATWGYSRASAAQQLQLIACLSRWMASRPFGVEDLTPTVIEEFFRWWQSTHRNYRTPRSLVSFLIFLEETGRARVMDPAVSVPAWERTLALFVSYLTDERGLRSTTVDNGGQLSQSGQTVFAVAFRSVKR